MALFKVNPPVLGHDEINATWTGVAWGETSQEIQSYPSALNEL